MNAEVEESVGVANFKDGKEFSDCAHEAKMADWLVFVLKDELLLCNSCVGLLCQVVEVFID